MNDRPALIGVESVEEHEDGSATYQLHMDDHAQSILIEEGIKFILHCAAAKVDIDDVYTWILAQMPADEEPEAKLPEGRTPLSDDWFREKAAAFSFDEYGNYGENNGPLEDIRPIYDDLSENTLDSKHVRELDEEERQRSKERDKINGKSSTYNR